jgi:hypothetical protein
MKKNITTIIKLTPFYVFFHALALNLLKGVLERSKIPFNKFRASAGRNNFRNIILFLSLILSTCCTAHIIESDTLLSVLNYPITPNTLVIFDIDNTLAHPIEELSSDEWFCHLVDAKMLQGNDLLTSIYYALPAAFYAQFNIPLESTESTTAALIKQLIDKGIAVMALSTRSLFIAERTLEQLDEINIYFFMPHIDTDELVLPMPHPCLYKNGILFGGNNDKGQALTCFFNIMNYHPDTVIFVDDKMKHLLSVASALEPRNITFYGIRYSGCDERVRNFDPAKAEQQYRELKEKNKGIS